MLALFDAVHKKENEMHVAARQNILEDQLFARREMLFALPPNRFNPRNSDPRSEQNLGRSNPNPKSERR
jgi:hypothetical protein